MRPRRLGLESLEARFVLTTFGLPWPDPQHLTLSFVRDGTQADERTSQLFSWLDSRFQDGDWQREILRAFQTWLSHTNINLGVVAETGPLLSLGATGAVQGDVRFGDIRIGGLRMALAPSDGSTVADALGIGSPFDPLAGTWSGDVNLNTEQPFGPGGIDLFTVVLHEAGHVFGLDHSEEEDSALFEHYIGVRIELSQEDIQRIQELYGIRQHDEFDVREANDTFSDATHIQVQPSGPTVLDGDLTTHDDVDYYRFSLAGSIHDATVRLRVAGRSLLAGELTILDEDGNVLASTSAGTQPGVDLELPFAIERRQRNFVVLVRASDGDFAIGGYQLEVIPAEDHGSSKPQEPGGPNPIEPSSPIVNLQPRRYHSDERFSYYIADTLSVDEPTRIYQFFTPTGKDAITGPMTILAWAAEPNGFRPRLTLLDKQGQVIEANVLVNEAGTYMLQLPDPIGNQPYLLLVSGNPGGGGQNVPFDTLGDFHLGIQFEGVVSELTMLHQDATFAPGSVATGSLHVLTSQVFHIVLSARGEPGELVQVDLIDSQGRSLITLTATGGETTTATLFLPAGDYRVRTEAPGQGESTVDLGVIALSNPMGPAARDVVQDPQGLPAGAMERGYWWEMGLPIFVTGPTNPGSPPSSPNSPPTNPVPTIPAGQDQPDILGTNGPADGFAPPLAGDSQGGTERRTIGGGVSSPGIAFGSRVAGEFVGAGVPTVVLIGNGQSGVGSRMNGSVAFVPWSSGGGATPASTAENAPQVSSASGWLVPPHTGGPGMIVRDGPLPSPTPDPGLQETIPLPADDAGRMDNPSFSTDVEASATVSDSEPVKRDGWLWRSLGFAVLASGTTVWLLHRPRRSTSVLSSVKKREPTDP